MTMMAHTTFKRGTPMNEDDMRRFAPSIFATTAHESRTERFRPIPTITILRGLMKEGFMPMDVRQSRVRDESKHEFTRHMIRLRRFEEQKNYQVGDVFAEAVLKNANDGTSSYQLMLGLWRVRCLNGMIANVGEVDSVKVRHTGDVMQNVIEGTWRVLSDAPKALEAPDKWAQIKLARKEAVALASSAHLLRFADAEGHVDTPITPEQLLHPRRTDDATADLWTTFNVIQENVIKGGLTGIRISADGRNRRVSTRQVNGIDQDIRLNRALWTLAEKMAELKS